MQKIYFSVFGVFAFCMLLLLSPNLSIGQACGALTATSKSYESRCTATGSIKVVASGGSGSYKYKVNGPVNTNFTSSDSITGLAAGVYSVIVNDIVTNCTFVLNNATVVGNYNDPRFSMNGFDVTCDNGNNGRITLNTQSFGRAPYGYAIVAPSPMGIGTTNTTGKFNSLVAGVYTIRLTDSCGGIQTRIVTINNYTWKIDSFSFRKISCETVVGSITASDSKGNISTFGGLPGFTYGVVRAVGDTVWSSNAAFSFNLSGQNTFEVIVKDPCGKIKKGNAVVNFKPTVSANVSIYNAGCSTFTAALAGVRNFFGPKFCLYNNSNVELACNATGIFTNLAYGKYCISAYDSCSDTTIRRCFTSAAPVLGVGNNTLIKDKTCNTFTAVVTGQVGLTSPQYCLKDSLNNTIACNSTGVFNNLAYGSYCINVKDNCRDTTIVRCFAAAPPRPFVPAVILPAYAYCTVFGVVVGGDSLTSPLYCLFDNNNVQISCNTTGIFNNLPYGKYCITVHDSCFDTTITRCISVLGPIVINDLVVNRNNQTCTSFSFSTTGGGSIIDPGFCLYNDQNVLVECNESGIFSNLPYGSYCLKVKTVCPDTSFTYCFSEYPPLPALNSNVVITKRNCTTFNVNTSGEQNFTTQKYCLFNANNVKLSCNTTGVFANLIYGSYCIKIQDGCYDTLVLRCFNVLPTPVKLTVSSKKSCKLGYASFSVNVVGGSIPVNIKIYKPDGTLFFNRNYNSATVNIDSIRGTLSGERYKIVVTDNCGNKDSVYASATASFFTHMPTVVSKCPSSTWANGSGSLLIKATSNTGTLTVRIMKRNGIILSPNIPPSVVSGSTFTFNNLEPAKYIVRYSANDNCNNIFYDTVIVRPYVYPNLNRSSVYQCDVNGFSLGAVVSNGVGPFMYEIIGSSPSSPSIVTSPQPASLFNVNNGTNYSLVRLRATDGCGNATLEDASILPLVNYGITATFNCFQLNTTLSVDTVYNSTYRWYKKTYQNSTDSVLLGTASSLYIPFVLPADTGFYFCDIVVNSGCIKRRNYFHLNGNCFKFLPVVIEDFTGKYFEEKAILNWKITGNVNLRQFIIERRNEFSAFSPIGNVMVVQDGKQNQLYNFRDTMPLPGKNYYRLKLINQNNTFTYSNSIVLSRKISMEGISIYPNPVNDKLTIAFKGVNSHNYKIRLMNLLNQVVKEYDIYGASGTKLEITRTSEMQNGVYVLAVFDKNTNENFSQKVIFQ